MKKSCTYHVPNLNTLTSSHGFLSQVVASWLQKRRQENQARRAAGEELLPEEDPTVMKAVPELSLLDNYLISNQMSTHCDQLNIASTQALQKLYVFEALQR